MKPDIKFGDILTYTEKWYKAIGEEKPEKPILFVATGKITEEMPEHYLIYVVRENRSYAQTYHYSFLEKVA